ncbi:hypothetical protein [Leucothrix arctica]|uniref:Uncharacterized protein n=1 Tax=Leucothrix arctica TaxID=1481894 RepID=A0A317CM69_9GAMM|nr:hypothetical protein [Leucothrix arctica]PWQ99321.1 hypothetical protein DKT75_01070 [Leucothrix arctica]
MTWGFFWEQLDRFGIIIGLITGVITMLIWLHLKWREKKDNDLIAVNLLDLSVGYKATLPCKIRRKNLTRAELQGLLGMLPMNEKGKRYELDGLNHVDFFSSLEKAQVSRDIYEVNILCTNDDLMQFDKARLETFCEISEI